jgi:uncharacterized protein YndB with AHSA1/START domain
MSQPSNTLVQVTQRYAASAERVFDAWLSPELLGKWMFGPAVREEEIVRLSVDARVGGAFSFVVRRGEYVIDHIGEYLELDRPRRLAFTWGIAGSDSSRVVLEITPDGPGCVLTLTHELHPDWAAYAARTEAGWTQMLAKLADVV